MKKLAAMGDLCIYFLLHGFSCNVCSASMCRFGVSARVSSDEDHPHTPALFYPSAFSSSSSSFSFVLVVYSGRRCHTHLVLPCLLLLLLRRGDGGINSRGRGLSQEKFCTDACVERFLKCKSDNVKKAAKHLRACLSWRDAIGTEHLMADEFSAELAEGAAYVAGHDDEARPVMVFRIKQDYPKYHSQKLYLRLLAFTLEVAISSMSRFVEQFVLLFDANFFRSASAFLNLFMGTLKIISEYYPGRLHRAFVIDPPCIFSCLWKGARPFVELWTSTAVVSSLDFEDSLEDLSPFASAYHPRTASLRFDPSGVPAPSAKVGGSTSSRFSFTVSHLDSLKPWYLTRTEPTPPSAAASPCLAGLSPLNARSFSFASPGTRSAATPKHHRLGGGNPPGARSIPSTPSSRQPPRTPRPSFLQSPAAAMRLFGGRSSKEAGGQDGGGRGRAEKVREAFLPFLRFYRRPYDEVVYRSKMRPPLGGLISIVSPHMIRQRRHLIHHQRF